jgi:hypothetical protein
MTFITMLLRIISLLLLLLSLISVVSAGHPGRRFDEPPPEPEPEPPNGEIPDLDFDLEDIDPIMERPVY